MDLRRLLIGTQLAYGLLAGLLWALAVAGKASVAVIVAISVAGGVVQIADSPARQAFVGALVTPEDLSSAVSLNGVVMNSARVVGPAIAGVLILTVGTTPCFGLNALSYLAVIAALIVLRPLRPARPRRAVGGVRDGLRYARGREQLWVPLVMMALVGLLAFNSSFVTLCSTTLQLHSSADYRGRIMALWVFVYMGTTPVGSIITGAISSAGGPRAALLTGTGACLVAAAIASRVRTPPHPDAALTDLGPGQRYGGA